MIDTHAHIYLDQFAKDEHEIVQRAKSEGVKKVLMPNIDTGTVKPMLAMHKKYKDFCLPMIGLHPCSVDSNYKKTVEELFEQLHQEKFYGIGETGLDFHWDTTYQNEQVKSLELHLEKAEKTRLPLILHTRNSFDQAIEIIEAHRSRHLGGIFHCFGGNAEDAERVINAGFLLGIGGVVTFKNSGLDKTLREVELRHVVLETDSPYLAPDPFRGKRNEPAYIKHICRKLSEIYRLPEEEIAEITTKNARMIFQIN